MVTLYWSALIWKVSIDHNMMSYIKKVHGKPGQHVFVNLLSGVWRHVARLHRRRLRRTYAPTKNTAGHDNMRKSIHGFLFFLYGYGALLSGPSGRRSSAMNMQIKGNLG